MIANVIGGIRRSDIPRLGLGAADLLNMLLFPQLRAGGAFFFGYGLCLQEQKQVILAAGF